MVELSVTVLDEAQVSDDLKYRVNQIMPCTGVLAMFDEGADNLAGLAPIKVWGVIEYGEETTVMGMMLGDKGLFPVNFHPKFLSLLPDFISKVEIAALYAEKLKEKELSNASK